MITWPWRLRDVGGAAAMAVLAFVLTGLPPATLAPNPVIVAATASVAVCALVLPGVSGSFFLLTLGLYEPTISALNDRDLDYLATFAIGAVVGLALFVKVLQWLLKHRRRATLVVMTGLMAGSLRALWPWQGDDRALLVPAESVPSSVLFLALGMAAVVTLLVVERLAGRESAGREPGAAQVSEHH